jgi:hypothetical protein
MTVGVGIDSTRWNYQNSKATDLDLPRRWWTGPLIFGLTLIFVGLLGKFTSTLRGFTGIPKAHKAFAEKSDAAKAALAALPQRITSRTFRAPQSLSMLLMATWLMIVAFSFFAMWTFTHSGALLNTTALSLVGLGAGSLVFAKAIDSATDADKAIDDALVNSFRTSIRRHRQRSRRSSKACVMRAKPG